MPCWISGDQMSPPDAKAGKADKSIVVTVPVTITRYYTFAISDRKAKELAGNYRPQVEPFEGSPFAKWKDTFEGALEDFFEARVRKEIIDEVCCWTSNEIPSETLGVDLTALEDSLYCDAEVVDIRRCSFKEEG